MSNPILIYRAYATLNDGTANVNGLPGYEGASYINLSMALADGYSLVQDPSTGSKHSRRYLYVAPGALPSQGTTN